MPACPLNQKKNVRYNFRLTNWEVCPQKTHLFDGTEILCYTFNVKQLQNENEGPAPLESGCAALLMDVVPLIMRFIRVEMRSQRTRALSISQFRTLVFLYRNKGASLSEVANSIGLGLPSASKTIDALAERKLVIRTVLTGDRRYISLRLSERGHAMLAKARRSTEACLAERIATLSPAQQAMVCETMQALGSVFVQTETRSGGKRR